MAVVYSQNGVIVRQDSTWLANDNKVYVNGSASNRSYCTPNFNLASARVIEENIVCKESSWAPNVQFHLCGGQWYTGTSNKFNGIAVYLFADQIEFDYGNNVSGNWDFVTGISYDFSKVVRKNIVYDKNSGYATCKIYYDDNLVCTHIKPISDLFFENGIYYSIGGRRDGEITETGYIDFNKSYIRIDGKLVWGVDNLRKDEAVIGGKTYRTVKMPDGKVWLAENLDYKFCNIGGSRDTTTPNAWYYDNDEYTYGWNGYKCGLLYNWYAANLLNTNRSDLCPGWHVPSYAEWSEMVTAIGGASTAGTKLKALDGSAGTNWPNGWGGTDNYGMALLLSGRSNTLNFNFINHDAYIWTADTSKHAVFVDLTSEFTDADNVDAKMGMTLRLVRDAT